MADMADWIIENAVIDEFEEGGYMGPEPEDGDSGSDDLTPEEKQNLTGWDRV